MTPLHLEEKSLNAWPGLQTFLYDGWIVRLAQGYTKRANSVTPLYDGQLPLIEKIAAAESIYHAQPQPTIFRLLSFHPTTAQLDPLLAKRGYTQLDKTLVQTLDLSAAPPQKPADQTTAVSPAEFLAAYHDLQQTAPNPIHQRILQQAAGRSRFLIIMKDGQLIGVGMSVLDGQTIGIFDMFTHPEYRRRGFGRLMMMALLRWGKQNGANTAYLQVVAKNQPAQNLYASLGFSNLYHYWYRKEKNS